MLISELGSLSTSVEDDTTYDRRDSYPGAIMQKAAIALEARDVARLQGTQRLHCSILSSPAWQWNRSGLRYRPSLLVYVQFGYCMVLCRSAGRGLPKRGGITFDRRLEVWFVATVPL